MQLLEDAREKMGVPEDEDAAESHGPADDDKPKTGIQRAAARCWALLLVWIYECLPLLCPKCGEPMRIIAFVLDPPVIERILNHIGEPSTPPLIQPLILDFISKNTNWKLSLQIHKYLNIK